MKSEKRMEVELGGVGALRCEREETLIWLSPDVPFWGLVRSRIERESSTELQGDHRFQPKPKRTVTGSVLLSFSRPAGR